MLVYVNWSDRRIISEEDFRERVAKDFDHGEYDDCFSDYLDDHYTTLELFDLCDDDKDSICDDFRDDFIEDIMDNGDDEFDPYEI